MLTTEGFSCLLQRHKHQCCKLICQVHPANDHSLHSIAAGSYFNKVLPELLYALYVWLSVWLNIPSATVKVYKDPNHFQPREIPKNMACSPHFCENESPVKFRKGVKASLEFPTFLLMLVTRISHGYGAGKHTLDTSKVTVWSSKECTKNP